MSKPNLLFVYDHKYPEIWRDGLWAALKLLEKDFYIEWVNLNDGDQDLKPRLHDFTLGWGAFNSEVDKVISNFVGKKGLCIGGNVFPYSTLAEGYDILFYETDWFLDRLDWFKGKKVKAFGINTDIYKPMEGAPKIWGTLGVGSFARWKRWEKMIGKPQASLVIGEYQEGNREESREIVENLLLNGVMVSNMRKPESLATIYNLSKNVYIPADINGGGERAILEARSCGIPVEIEPDNPKLKEVLKWTPIPDQYWYAEQLKKGIMSCLN